MITADGFVMPKEPGTDLFARRFHDAGFGVLAFGCRGFGESGGRPRQVASVSGQLADWRAAVTFATTLPGVDRSRLAVWGFSPSARHLFRVAARHQKPFALLCLLGRGVLDAACGLLGRPPLLAPLGGAPGTVAVLTTPDTAAVRATRRAPRAELVWLPGGHYAPFLDAHERAVDAELSFLRRMPVAFGWLTLRGDAATARWIGPVLERPEIRRDAVRTLRAAAADTGLLLAAAERLPRFDRPALVVWAHGDPAMPPEHGRRLSALLPRGLLVEIDDSYTLVPLDRPKELALAIREFTRSSAAT